MTVVSEWQVELYITPQVFLTKDIKINYVTVKGGGKVMEMNLFCLLLGNNFIKGLLKHFFQVRMSAKTESVLKTVPVVLMRRCRCFPAISELQCRSAYPFTFPG